MPTIYGNINAPDLKKKRKAPGVATPLTGVQASTPGMGSEIEEEDAKPPQMGGVYGEEKEPTNDPDHDAAVEKAKDAAKEKAKAKAKAARDGDLNDLVDMREQHQREIEAAREEQRVQRAKGLMDVRARSGVAGLGLSGATSALEGDFSRSRDRADLLAIAEMREGQRDEEWKSLQRQIALEDLEAATGQDLDGDGDEGGARDDSGSAREGVPADVDKAAEKMGATGGEALDDLTKDDVKKMPRLPDEVSSYDLENDWTMLGYAYDGDELVIIWEENATGALYKDD